MKSLYIRFVLLLILPAIRSEAAAREAAWRKQDKEFTLATKGVIDEQLRPGGVLFTGQTAEPSRVR